MLRLITAVLPARLHRRILQIAFRLRRHWRKFVKLPLAGVAVICRDADGRLLFVKHSYGQSNWAFPGGGCNRGEAPATAARREMDEELGLSLGELHLLAQEEETISGSPHTAYLFLAEVENIPQPDEREIIVAQFFSPDDLPHNIASFSRRWLGLYLEQR